MFILSVCCFIIIILNSTMFNLYFFTMKTNKLVLFLLFNAFPSMTLLAQNIEVKGKVVVFNTVPVINANVAIPGSDTIVKTDDEGRFSCMCKENDKLVFTAEGFCKLSIKIKKKKAKQVIAKMKLLKLTGASKIAIEKGHILQVTEFVELQNKKLGVKNYSKYKSLNELFRSEFPSLRTINGVIIIRGESSIYASSAARFVVDGMMVSQSEALRLLPFSISSIRILEPNECTLYGVRGGTGVIEIKTKRSNLE